jgi:hypothetical protein
MLRMAEYVTIDQGSLTTEDSHNSATMKTNNLSSLYIQEKASVHVTKEMIGGIMVTKSKKNNYC